MINVAIVGAGPAGVAAADVLVAHGVAVTVIDEGREAGGQIYRRARAGLKLDVDALMGTQAANYRSFHAVFERLRGRIDYQPETLVWGIEAKRLHTLRAGVADAVAFDALILATGATDRTLPVPGWTLPGVFTLGGAQVLLKEHGCLIGRRIVFCGSSPLLYLAAKQYRAIGGEVVAILDTTPFAAKMGAALDLLAAPLTSARGLGYMRELRRVGVSIHQGVRLTAFEGAGGIERVRFRDRGGREHVVACDAVAYGFGLKPETQLADLAGIEFRYDTTFRQWLPHAERDGRCGTGVYVAGDGATIGGARTAALTGKLAACAVLDDLGITVGAISRAAMRSEVARLCRFQRGLARAFAWPVAAIHSLDEGTVVCRCEGVTAGELRASVRAEFGPTEVNRLKAITRCGMGRCQGRFCGLAAAELTAHATNMPLEAVGRLRGQAPVKPIPLAISLAGNVAAAARDGTSAPA